MSWKYRIRLVLVPILARLGRRLGMSWLMLGQKLGSEVIIAQGRAMKKGMPSESEEQSLDVIILTMIGGHRYNTSVDITLGLALKGRGHKVRYVVCDQGLEACEVKKAGSESRWQQSCAKCWGYGKSLYAAFGLEVIPVSGMIDESDPKDEPWEEIVEASLLKHYRVGVLSDEPHVHKRRKAYRKSANTSAAIGRKLVDMKPDRVLMSHGIYSTWGPQREILNQAGIPTLTFSKCKKRNTEKFNWMTSGDWWDVSEEWDRVKDQPLSAQQEALVDKYLDSRRDHSSDTLKYNFGEEESKAKSFDRLNLDPSKPTFVAFTNVLWDAASAQREIVFSNPIAWILDTIHWFSDHPNLQLVVKVHPAEVVIGTNQPFATIIKESIPKLPANVRVIEPSEKVNSWSIMQVADLGLVHTSTIGMEMPLEGIPCAVVSKTHFRGRGFTIDVNDRDEYFHLIENWDPNSCDIESIKDLAKRYAFLLFERYQLPFPFFHEVSHTDVRAMNFSSISALTKHPVMRLIVNSIETKQSFLMPSDPKDIEIYWEPVS